MKNTILAAGVLAIGFLSSCQKQLEQQPASASNELPVASSAKATTSSQGMEALPSDEIILQFKPGTSESSKKNVVAKINGTLKKEVHTKAMEAAGNPGFYVVKASNGLSEAIAHAKAFSEVDFAEPNYVFTHQATANDPYASSSYLWGMHTNYGSQAVTAWGKNQVGSSTVVVGIIDEGVNIGHPDLKDNIWRNTGEVDGNGVDDDRNGYIDDVNGWDFYNNDKTVYDGVDDDHGTHVAGTIGAKGNNAIGVAGMCWNVTMIPAKFMGTNGGYVSDAIEAIDYLVNLKATKGLNLVAINNSWGGGGYSSALYSAIDRANNAGILFMAAAGNGDANGVGYDIDKQPTYPASYSNANVVTVAAIDVNGAMASFSNYGLNSVELGAPGVTIASTVPGGYAYYSGTSMATPHVTGAAALYAAVKGLRPRTAADAAAIKTALLTAAKNTRTNSLYGKTYTGGRLNVGGF